MKMEMFVVMRVTVDMPTFLGEGTPEEVKEAQEICFGAELPSILESKTGPPIIVDKVYINQVYRVPDDRYRA